MGEISTTSMVPSGIMKWGCPFSVSASASFESACKIEYPPRSRSISSPGPV